MTPKQKVDLARWQRVGPLLDRALELEGEERTAWLAELRQREPMLSVDLDQLLRDHQRVLDEGFLEDAVVAPRPELLAGHVLGAYRLVAPIGQGGMGTVWLAERADGRFEGRVAVKLLNLSLIGASPSNGARGGRAEERFKREGSVLARLTHPNIARLIDAGVSAAGQPYLVLELVEGQPIDRYCDERSLSIADRVRLFLNVLSAVADAHAHLVVHRDVKPSNVLVTPDGHVKLLDFGIAKLLEEESGDFLTRDGGAALTPEFAAPEQVTGQRVTTATDVYSLGVLLYVLLSGRHPARLALASLAELLQAIVETEPQRVSAAVRGTASERLSRVLRGDLDTIVAKALKKSVDERYSSVTAFADDLRRYLDRQPIAARPDTIAYRTSKFVRRHAVGVALASAVVLLVTGLVSFYTVRLAEERDRARTEATKAEKVSALMTGLLTGADPFRDQPDPTVRDLLKAGESRVEQELAGEPALLADMLTEIGRVRQRLGDYDQAQALLERALSLERSGSDATLPDRTGVAETLNVLGVVMRTKGDYARSSTLLEQALEKRRRLLGPMDKDLAITLSELGRTYADWGQLEKAESYSREALEMRLALFGEQHRETATNMADLGNRLRARGDLAGAEPLLRQSLDVTRRLLGEGHPNTAGAMSNLGLVVVEQGNLGEAETLFREALRIGEASLGADHPTLAGYSNSLGRVLRARGEYAESITATERAIALATPALGDESVAVAGYRLSLAQTLLDSGDARKAEPLLRQALAVRRRAFSADDWRVGVVQSVLGSSFTALGRFDEAEAALLEAKRTLKDGPGQQGAEARATLTRLAALEDARAQLVSSARRR